MLWEGKIRINATPQEMEQMDDQVLQQFLAGKPADPADVE
jgi:ABC-type transporter Mla maintaining outer membrane lipid asymmetry ATPase subunit MlaF